MDDMDQIVREFLVESNENLDQLDQDLITLEKDPKAQDVLSSIFRTIHTIKGTTGFLGFSRLESVAHVGENLLSGLRDGRLSLSAEITSALLALVDAIRQMLAHIEATGKDGEADYSALIDTLTRLQGGEKKTQQTTGPQAAAPESPSVSHPAEEPSQDTVKPEASLPVGEILVEAGGTDRLDVNEALKLQQEGDSRRLGEILVEKGAAKPAAVQEALLVQAEARASAISEGSIRVDVGLLDKLMNLVGELVLARNQILQFSSSQQDSSFLGTTQRLNLITTELQEGVMKTRMQPIGNIWSKFPRVVRDLATACGKQVRLEMEGKETELDKTLIEAIKDPLTHVVRNAVDHGIETPEKRQAAGKAGAGRLFLRAFHEGGQVNIEISDDGAGIDSERVREKALSKGLVTSEQAARMSEREVLNLVFLPGLSTAERVTNVSGRGVGMDVVKTNIEKIGGTVDVQSHPGAGTTLKIKIPLTLAIIPALIVTSGGDRYAIPQVSLLELVRLEGEQASKAVEMIHGAPVYRLRGKLLPLVYLNEELRSENGPAGEVGGPRERARLASSGSPTASLDAAEARREHEAWGGKLKDFLEGRAPLTPGQAASHEDCELGRWLRSPAAPKSGEMEEFEKLHHSFHQALEEAVSAKNSGDVAGGDREFRRVEDLSGRISSFLQGFEHQDVAASTANIVVLQADDRQFGLVVDEINDTEEIVVKPLGKQLKGISTFAGATIMGDGRVALILDVLGLAQRANVVSEIRDRSVSEKMAEAKGHHEDSDSLLLLRGNGDRRMAMPLSLVARLEEFSSSSLERSEGREVVQYRDQILPLIDLSSRPAQSREPSASSNSPARDQEGEKIQVVVYSDQGRSVGLIVDRIVDITKERVKIQRHAAHQGTLGSMVVQGQVTELLDLKGIIEAADASSPNP